MARISREEMLTLLGPAPVAQTGEKSVPEPVTAPQAPASPLPLTSPYGRLHGLLARALPRLWRYAKQQPEASEVRALRRKLRELVSWVLTKEGYCVSPNAPTPYHADGREVQGRLELLVTAPDGSPLLALETDFTGEPDSLHKLAVWHARGVPVLWIVGRPCKPEDLPELRRLAGRTLRERTFWLPIYHLEHGWVKSSRPRNEPVA